MAKFNDKNILKVSDTLQNGKYTIKRVLGKGGFGITYLATHKILRSNLAIKELFLSAAQTYCTRTGDNTVVPQFDSDKFDEFKQKFNDEAYTLSKLKGVEGVVQVIDTFEENATSYFVMEFVEGKSIRQIVKEHGKFTVKKAVDYTVALLNTMQKVHENKILHRDINPNNILINEQDKPVLIDFGIAREYEQDVTLTQTTFRTPGYYAPEQAAQRAKRGAYTDTYSIGATLYYLLTAERPETIEERNLEGLTEPKKINSEIPDWLNKIIVKSINLRPNNRYQTSQDFVNDLLNSVIPLNTSTDEETLIDNEEYIPQQDDDVTLIETDHETELWEDAVFDADIQLLKKYLQKYPNGKYKKQAQTKIGKLIASKKDNPIRTDSDKKKNKLLIPIVAVVIVVIFAIVYFAGMPNEKSDFQNAQNQNTVESYEQYLSDYPQGDFTKQATENISWLRTETENSLTAYNLFIQNYPASEHIEKAKKKVQRMELDNILALNNTNALQQYIQNNPSGAYIEDAKLKIEELRKDSIENAKNQKATEYLKLEGRWYLEAWWEAPAVWYLNFSFKNDKLNIKCVGVDKNSDAFECIKIYNIKFDGKVLRFKTNDNDLNNTHKMVFTFNKDKKSFYHVAGASLTRKKP